MQDADDCGCMARRTRRTCELNAGEEATLAEGRPCGHKGTRPRGVTLLPRRAAARRGAPRDEDAEVGIWGDAGPPRSQDHRTMPLTVRSLRCGPTGPDGLGAVQKWTTGPLCSRAGRVHWQGPRPWIASLFDAVSWALVTGVIYSGEVNIFSEYIHIHLIWI